MGLSFVGSWYPFLAGFKGKQSDKLKSILGDPTLKMTRPYNRPAIDLLDPCPSVDWKFRDSSADSCSPVARCYAHDPRARFTRFR